MSAPWAPTRPVSLTFVNGAGPGRLAIARDSQTPYPGCDLVLTIATTPLNLRISDVGALLALAVRAARDARAVAIDYHGARGRAHRQLRLALGYVLVAALDGVPVYAGTPGGGWHLVRPVGPGDGVHEPG